MPMGGWPGDEGKVIAGMEGPYISRSCLHLLFWAGSQLGSLAVFWEEGAGLVSPVPAAIVGQEG